MSLLAQIRDRGVDTVLEAAPAIRRVLDALRVTAPATMLILVEDAGAANFAAGLLAALAPHGRVTIHAKGQGAAQLERLGVGATPLQEPFDATALLTRARPGLVLVGTSENPHAMAHDLVTACRAGRIPTVGFVDGPANIDRRFRGSGDTATAFVPDMVLVPTPRLRARLMEAGLAAERIVTVAHPHFSRIGEEGKRLGAIGRAALRARLFPDCPDDRPVLVFLAERSGGLDAREFRRNAQYTLRGRGGDDRRTNIVLEELLDAVATMKPRPFVVLRLHPNNNAAEFSTCAGEIDQVSRQEPATEIVYAADAVVGLTTILLAEAAVLGRPVLSVVPRASEREWLLDPPSGPIRCVWERASFAAALNEMLAVGK